MWFLLALGSAFSWATADAFAKKQLRDQDSITVIAVRLLYSLPLLWLLVPFIEFPVLTREFAITVAVALPFEVAAALLYMAALKRSPMSLCIPYLAFTPVFLIVTAYFILDETVSTGGLFGILAVTAGAYVLGTSGVHSGIFAPLKNIWHEKGSVMMLGVAFLYSITGAVTKKAIILSSPEFFAIFYFHLMALCFLPLVFSRTRRKAVWSLMKPNASIMAMGAFFAAMILFHSFAIRLVEAPYMISVKRTSMIFSVMYGWILFREREVGVRLFGTAIMFAGILMIVFC